MIEWEHHNGAETGNFKSTFQLTGNPTSQALPQMLEKLSKLPQFRKLGVDLHQDGDVGVRVFPERTSHACDDLFLTQKIQVCVADGAHINDGREILREIVGITTKVSYSKSKGDS